MDPKMYLRKHHIMTYIEDGTTQLLSKRDSKIPPLMFLLKYFKSVQNGSHIKFREYSFISATPHNRASFIKLLWQSYFSLSQDGVAMKIKDYFPLLQLLCSDFPPNLIQLVQALHQPPNTDVEFVTFLYTFQVVFYFESFLVECHSVYHSLLMGIQYYTAQTNKPILSVVVLPRSDSTPLDDQTATKSTSSAGRDEVGVQDSNTTSPLVSALTDPSCSTISTVSLTQSLTKLCGRLREKQPWVACPAPSSIHSLLADSSTDISLHSFLHKLMASNDINQTIGVLPSKHDFLNSSPHCD